MEEILIAGVVRSMIENMTDEVEDLKAVSLDQANSLLTAEDNDRTLPETCRECRGGIDASAFTDTLNQSRLS